MEELSKQINEDGQSFKELEVSTAIENDTQPKEESLDELLYSNGKELDEIDKLEAEEKLLGADKISPFGTNHVSVFKRKLSTASIEEMTRIAEKTATRISADRETQHNFLLKSFHEWRSTNWGSTGGRTEEKVKLLASDSKDDFEKMVRGKTLSELQEMAMKLGFTPSFDRERIISVLKQEYLKRG